MKKTIQLSVALLLTSSIAAHADVANIVKAAAPITELSQQSNMQVTGTVFDGEGLPIIGANIIVKGNATIGTITDVDGRFTLSVPKNATLVISYIGYKNQEVKANKEVLKITLQEDSETLGEVVVTALGIKREEKALGYATQKSVETNYLL